MGAGVRSRTPAAFPVGILGGNATGAVRFSAGIAGAGVGPGVDAAAGCFGGVAAGGILGAFLVATLGLSFCGPSAAAAVLAFGLACVDVSFAVAVFVLFCAPAASGARFFLTETIFLISNQSSTGGILDPFAGLRTLHVKNLYPILAISARRNC